MKVFIPFEDNDFAYPDEMAKIIEYLKAHGEVKVKFSTIEALYREFSGTRCAGWLSVNDEMLEDFAEWLSEVDL